MIPVIAIIGRPNVGKSTLFNCLTASRSALVSNIPGMTRDRQYGEATFKNHRFIVIDTGGITQEDVALNELISQQALQAIREADKILMIADGKSGFTYDDQAILKIIRGNAKPTFLVVNKIDTKQGSSIFTDFYALGLGTPLAISAAHKIGIDELVEHIFKDQPPRTTESSLTSDDQTIKLTIVGRPNVGKSTLINRLLGEERVIVSNVAGTTRDSIAIPFTRQDQAYTLIDTAGLRRRGKVFETAEKFSIVKTLQAIEATHVVLLLMNAVEGITEHDLKLIGFILESGKALVLAVNKWDGLSAGQRQQVENGIDRRLRFLRNFIRIHFISALHGSGVGNLFPSIEEAFQSAHKKLHTTKLTDLLIEAVQTHEPPLVKGRRIKLRHAHPGGNNPPVVVIHGNQLTALPKSYVRYLINTFQTRLKLMGTPLRIELKNSVNPFKNQANKLNTRQQQKKKRLVSHIKKNKKRTTKSP